MAPVSTCPLNAKTKMISSQMVLSFIVNYPRNFVINER
jgi:hypothetical protein